MFLHKPVSVIAALSLVCLALSISAAQAMTMAVPAVDNDGNGVLTSITLDSAPGTGGITLRLHSSTVSPDTQESIRTAVEEGAKLAGKDSESYDFTVGFDETIGNVNGPSAGAAMALMAYSGISGERMAPGFILTGTVEHGGLVGPVGGIKEKIDATGNNGSFRTMAIPAASLDDFSGNVLDSLYFPDYARTKYNLTVVLVPNISYAAAIATGKIAAPAAQQASEFFPDEYSPAPQSEPFKLVASLVMSQMSDASDGTNLTPLQKQAFARLAGRARGQLSQGYYYTAANSAFLVKNALDQLRLYPLSKGEFLRVAENLRSEIESFKCALSSSNWEWASAGRLRKAWSGARLADALAQSNSSEIGRASCRERV